MTDKDLLNLILEDSKTEYLQQKHDEWEQRQFDKSDSSDWQNNGAHSIGPAGVKTQNLDNIYTIPKVREETPLEREEREKEIELITKILPEFENKVRVYLSKDQSIEDNTIPKTLSKINDYINLLKQIKKGQLAIKHNPNEYKTILDKDREKAELHNQLSQLSKEILASNSNDEEFNQLLRDFKSIRDDLSKLRKYSDYDKDIDNTTKRAVAGFKSELINLIPSLFFKLKGNWIIGSNDNLQDIEKAIKNTEFSKLVDLLNTQHKSLTIEKYRLAKLSEGIYDRKEIWSIYNTCNRENMPILEAKTLTLKLSPEEQEKIRYRLNPTLQHKLILTMLSNNQETVSENDKNKVEHFIKKFLIPVAILTNLQYCVNNFNTNQGKAMDTVKEEFSVINELLEKGKNYNLNDSDKEVINNLSELMIEYIDDDLKRIRNFNRKIELHKEYEKQQYGRN